MACIKTFGLQSENRFQMRQKARGREIQPAELAFQTLPLPYFGQKGKAFVRVNSAFLTKLHLRVLFAPLSIQ